MRPRLVFVLCFGLATCSPTSPTVGLNEEFELAPGETSQVAGTGLRIRFIGVSGDSRCPADAICIQGGDALVHIEVSSKSGARIYDLHTGDMRPVVHDLFTIALVNLAPYPFSSRPIRPDEYRATFRVTD